MTLTHWLAPAKLNLFLYITGRRADGYHQLQTLFQFLDYCDSIFITPRNDGRLKLLTPLPGVAEQDNLLIRAAKLLLEYAAQHGVRCENSGADIAIEKRLPIGGGLGGGSSNAATVLVALNQLWQCGFSAEQLAHIGLRLGADVPVFVRGHAAFARGIGEELTLANPPEKWYLVAYPGVQVATRAVFADPLLPRNTPARSFAELLNHEFINDCEVIVRKRFPEVDRALGWLLEYAPSRLTGSGSCVFAEFSSESAARLLLKQAPEWLHCFVARGVNISPLWQAAFGQNAPYICCSAELRTKNSG